MIHAASRSGSSTRRRPVGPVAAPWVHRSEAAGLTIRPATLGDGRHLARRLRQEDVDELEAMTDHSAAESLDQAIRRSVWCMAVCIGDGPAIAIFGLAKAHLLGDLGYPWLMASPELALFPRATLVLGRRIVSEMLRIAPRLENVIDSRYARALRYAEHLGFQLLKPVQLWNGHYAVRIRMGDWNV